MSTDGQSWAHTTKSFLNYAKSRPKGLNPAKAIAEIKRQMVERVV